MAVDANVVKNWGSGWIGGQQVLALFRGDSGAEVFAAVVVLIK